MRQPGVISGSHQRVQSVGAGVDVPGARALGEADCRGSTRPLAAHRACHHVAHGRVGHLSRREAIRRNHAIIVRMAAWET